MRGSHCLISVLFINVFVFHCGGESFRLRFSIVALPFRFHGITPKYIDAAPKELLEVSWPHFEARLGNRGTATNVALAPKLAWDCERNVFYTVCLFDCEVLGREHGELLSEGQNWLVGNIPGCDVNNGQIINEYLSPTPVYGTGYHRYVFLIFKQNGTLVFEEPFVKSRQLEHRFYTDMKKLAVKYNLGDPVAGNFALIGYDKHSDQTFAEFEQPLPLYITRAIAQADLPQRPASKHFFNFNSNNSNYL